MKIKSVRIQKIFKTDKGVEMVGTVYKAPAIPEHILREVELDNKGVFFVEYVDTGIIAKKRESKTPPPAEEPKKKPVKKKVKRAPRKAKK